MQHTPLASFDDLSVGQEFSFGTYALSAAEIIDYASKYDRQPFHLDPEAALNAPLFGGLVASGLHTMGVVFGAVTGSGLLLDISLGGNRIDTRWPAPLRPDEAFAVTGRVLELKASRSRPELGICAMLYEGKRVADGVVVITMEGTHFLKR
jgi:acyl dehydratase